MNRKIYLASHGTLSHGLEDSAKMICGIVPYSLETFSLLPGMSPQEFADSVLKSVTAEPNTEHIILTDLFGASVCSALYPLSSYQNVFLFSGMNLNILLSICVEYPDSLSKNDAKNIVKTAQQGIKFLEFKEVQAENF